MDAVDIERILSTEHTTRGLFKGVYPSDKLKARFVPKPSAYVINLDPARKPGTHWVGVYFDGQGNSEYFDSYGLPPHTTSIKTFLRSHTAGHTRWNTRKLQGDFSTVCGQYVIYFLTHRVRGHSMKDIVNPFSTNTDANDNFVKDFVKKHYHYDGPVQQTEFMLEQIYNSLH